MEKYTAIKENKIFDNINQTTIRYAEYTYDNAGNTTQRTITDNGIPSTTSYTYYDDNRIHTVTLPSSELITFTYFADGSRATKESATEWITYHYAAGLVKEVHHLASDHNTTTFTLHYEPGRIIYEPYGGTPTTYYTVTDTQGTIYKLLDTQGTTLANYTYDPFGNRLTNSAPTIYNPIGFAGTYYDSETNLLYASSRYLDPTTSRFTTKDSYRGDLQSHISQNRYIYCHQNPISYSDPSGFAPIEGDNSNSTPTSTTRTKTEHKENITPPKNEVNAKNPHKDKNGKVRPNTGECIKNEDGSYTINIRGREFNITFDSNGKAHVKFNHYYNPTGEDGKGRDYEGSKLEEGMALGLEDALNVPETKANFLKDPSNFALEVDNFWKKNFGKFMRMMRNGDVPYLDLVSGFMFSAAVGYSVSQDIAVSGNQNVAILMNLLADALSDFSTNFGESMDLREFLMTQAFWATYHNSHRVNGHNVLDISYGNVNGNKGMNDSVGLTDIVLMNTKGWLVTSAMGTFNGQTGFDWDKAKLQLNTVLTILSVFPGTTKVAVTLKLIASAASGILSFIPNDSSDYDIDNSFGITNEMFQTLKMYGLTHNKFITGEQAWNKQGLFEGIGMQNHYLGLCLDIIGKGKNTKGMDLLAAINMQMQSSSAGAETGWWEKAKDWYQVVFGVAVPDSQKEPSYITPIGYRRKRKRIPNNP